MGLIRRALSTKDARPIARADPHAHAIDRSTIEAVGTLVRVSRLDEALRMADAHVVQNPGAAALVYTRGCVLFELGRAWEARRDLLEAERLGHRDSRLDLQLGWLELWAGNVEESVRRMQRAISDGGGWEAHFGLASALNAKGERSAARDCFERSLNLSPGNIDCLLSLVTCAIEERKFDEAEAYARRATSEPSASSSAWASLGIVLVWQDRVSEAASAFDRAREVASTEGDAANPVQDAGIPLRDGGRVDDAIAFYRRLLPIHPDLNAHGHYAYSLLKAGLLREGWEQNEFRWMNEPLRALVPRPPIPVWTGQDVHGKTVLIMGEQGIGDTIQFIRYAQPLKARGATVLVLLRKRMREIVEGVPGVDAVYEVGDEIPAIDYRVPLMSLPRAFDTTLDTIPSGVPYVPLEPRRVDRWRREIASDGLLNVGIAWAGDPVGSRNPYKSIRLDLLAPLGKVAGARFYALQKGEAAKDALHAPPELRLVDLSPGIRDLADTAAIIESLDLVITICTSVAHLAGALGKPVWTLLSDPADWRWMEGRADTPWYPTMRLFRQARQGDWTGVVAEVSRTLAGAVGDRRRLRTGSSTARFPGSDSTDRDSGSRSSDGICRAAETRYGMLQFRPDASSAARSIEWYGEYRHRQLTFLHRRIERGAVIVDVASGSGFDSAYLASAAGDRGHLFLLESRPAHAPILANNLRANDVSNATHIRYGMPAAFEECASGSSNLSASDGLDGLRLPPFQVLKINEGADPLRTVARARDCLWNYRPAVLMLLDEEPVAREAADCVEAFGYQCLRIDFSFFDPGNFNRRTDDIFDGRMALALFALPEELDMRAARDDWMRIAS
jgi:tetratricopeptide (TPR) repeat protein